MYPAGLAEGAGWIFFKKFDLEESWKLRFWRKTPCFANEMIKQSRGLLEERVE